MQILSDEHGLPDHSLDDDQHILADYDFRVMYCGYNDNSEFELLDADPDDHVVPRIVYDYVRHFFSRNRLHRRLTRHRQCGLALARLRR